MKLGPVTFVGVLLLALSFTGQTFFMLSPSWSCSLLSITVMNANIHCANMAPHYFFGVEPLFGYNELERYKIKMATP